MNVLNRFLALFGLALIAKESGVLDRAGVVVSDVLNDDDGNGLPDIEDVIADRLTARQVYNLAVEITSRYNLRVSPLFATTIASMESSFKPRAYRFEKHINDASYGLMQTLWRTAKDMESKGYDAIRLREPEDLYNPRTSMYYGIAYLHWLQKHFPGTEEEIARKYNGGPRGHRLAGTLPYLEKFRDRKPFIQQELRTV